MPLRSIVNSDQPSAFRAEGGNFFEIRRQVILLREIALLFGHSQSAKRREKGLAHCVLDIALAVAATSRCMSGPRGGLQPFTRECGTRRASAILIST